MENLEKGGTIISKDRAKEIASNWHGGQNSALYQFLSSGVYMPENHLRYLQEVQQNIDYPEQAPHPYDLAKKDERELNSLKRFFEYKGEEAGIKTEWHKHELYGYPIPYVSKDTPDEIAIKVKDLKYLMEKGGAAGGKYPSNKNAIIRNATIWISNSPNYVIDNPNYDEKIKGFPEKWNLDTLAGQIVEYAMDFFEPEEMGGVDVGIIPHGSTMVNMYRWDYDEKKGFVLNNKRPMTYEKGGKAQEVITFSGSSHTSTKERNREAWEKLRHKLYNDKKNPLYNELQREDLLLDSTDGENYIALVHSSMQYPAKISESKIKRFLEYLKGFVSMDSYVYIGDYNFKFNNYLKPAPEPEYEDEDYGKGGGIEPKIKFTEKESGKGVTELIIGKNSMIIASNNSKADGEEQANYLLEHSPIDWISEWRDKKSSGCSMATGGGVEGKEYKLIFANQSIDTAKRYRLIRETKDYVFLEEITKEPNYIFRVHKRTLSVKGFKRGGNGYQFDVPSAISLIELDKKSSGGSVVTKGRVDGDGINWLITGDLF